MNGGVVSATAARWRQRFAWYSRIAAGRARRAARLALASAGRGVTKEFLLIDCADGAEASGLFSEAAAVLGCAGEVEAYPELYAGMRVDFQDHGLYYDAAVGPNWWEYFFEPLTIGASAGAMARTLSDWEHDAHAARVELDMPRADAARLLRKYMRVKPALLRDCDAEWHRHTGDAAVIGVHYRGTDKWEGAPVIGYDLVAAAVRDAAAPLPHAAWSIFLATDEQACVDYMMRAFPDRVWHRDITRSTDGTPLHKTAGDGFRKGRDAVLDCLLLSRCTHLVRTDSDLGLFATFFNPAMPVTMLGTPT